jgi:hypothetical protein
VKPVLKRILLGFGFLSNIATLIGLWIAYISVPASVQARIGHALLIAGASCSVALYLWLAWLIFQPTNPRPPDSNIGGEPQDEACKAPKLEPTEPPEKTWGEIMAEEDAKKMGERVPQISQRKEFHFDPTSDPYIDIITELFNGSVFDLVTFGEIGGHVNYAGGELATAPRVLGQSPVMVRIKHGEAKTVTVRQSLSSTVADTMVANWNRGIAVNFESVSVSFTMFSPVGPSQTYRWWGPRFTLDEATRV